MSNVVKGVFIVFLVLLVTTAIPRSSDSSTPESKPSVDVAAAVSLFAASVPTERPPAVQLDELGQSQKSFRKSSSRTQTTHVHPANDEPNARVSSKGYTLLHSWGYNIARNIPRWRAIVDSIHEDLPDHKGAFSLIDYGADQGYFSVSAGHAFPKAHILAVEKGGSGGAIWDTRVNAIRAIRSRMRLHHTHNVFICEGIATPESFHQFLEAKNVVYYQLLLSVIHWFEIYGRAKFHAALVEILRTAKVTFIEFPYLGTHNESTNQVGYDRFSKWFEGESDAVKIVEAACANKAANPNKVKCAVSRIASLPWIAPGTTRDIIRVEVTPVEEKYDCKQRREILKCAQSHTYDKLGYGC